MTILRWIWGQIQAEPSVTYGLIQSALGLAGAFGLHMTGEQLAETLTLTQVFLMWLTRQSVTPNATLAKVGISTQTAVVQEPPPSPQPVPQEEIKGAQR